ncbi:uncharacterized protein LOC144943833 [Lampetra fluviatilis]
MKHAVQMYVLGALLSMLTILFGILESIQGSTREATADDAESDYVRAQMDDIFGGERRMMRRGSRRMRGGADTTMEGSSSSSSRRRRSGGDKDGEIRKVAGHPQVLLGEATALRLYGH